MKVNALLDVNVVAHEAIDEVSVLLELQAPPSTSGLQRLSTSFEVVLDRSGSMHAAPLEGAKAALIALVQRLEPSDNFGLVVFDDTSQTVVPAGPLTDKIGTIARIQGIDAGGMTDLGGGYLRGLRELRRVTADGSGGTLLVISDGHVNVGMTDVDEFASITSKAYADRIVTSTLGYGRGYDERLLAAIARSGSGNHVFADNPDAAGAAIAQEVDGLLDKVVQAASLTVEFEPQVEMLRLYNDLPAQQLAGGQVLIELGDLYAEEERKLLIRFQVPAMAGLGAAQIATLVLQYVDLPSLTEQLVMLPIAVNVVPGDEVAGRVPHPTVLSEVLFQEAQESKRKASDAFEIGDLESGQLLLGEADQWLLDALEVAPPGSVGAIRSEVDDVLRMRSLTQVEDTAFLSKLTRDSYHRQNRKRGRHADDEGTH